MTETVYYNLARMLSLSIGDSDIVLDSAVAGCRTFEEAGVSDSEDVGYGLITYSLTTRQPVGSETGIGRYISSGTVFKRTSVEASTDSDNSAIDLTGRTEIYLTPNASRFNNFSGPFAYYDGGGDVTTIADGVDGNTVTVTTDSDSVDTFGLCTFTDSDDAWTVNYPGWYRIVANIGHYSNGSAYDGQITIEITVAGAANNCSGFLIKGYVAAWAILSDDPVMVETPLCKITNSTTTISVKVSNHSGSSIDAYVNNIVIERKGIYP